MYSGTWRYEKQEKRKIMLKLASNNPSPNRTPDTPKDWEVIRRDGSIREFHLTGANIYCPILPENQLTMYPMTY